ncbi:hypothetical protein MINTM018_42620 [Mycobacterium intracellulare]|uniref:Uncharacterized protein n=1 Tax=Mycobacterium intracellulare TaxID=1767 RepID=A0A7R7RP29_MYCIT|nr:hypothetical protein MINTM018_42620 [Mycobacterium intracellulare]
MVTPSPRVMIGGVIPGPCREKCSHRLSVIGGERSARFGLGWIARLLTRAVSALAVAGLGWIARLLTRAVSALAVAGLGSAI